MTTFTPALSAPKTTASLPVMTLVSKFCLRYTLWLRLNVEPTTLIESTCESRGRYSNCVKKRMERQGYGVNHHLSKNYTGMETRPRPCPQIGYHPAPMHASWTPSPRGMQRAAARISCSISSPLHSPGSCLFNPPRCPPDLATNPFQFQAQPRISEYARRLLSAPRPCLQP